MSDCADLLPSLFTSRLLADGGGGLFITDIALFRGLCDTKSWTSSYGKRAKSFSAGGV
jgi:hypothetical protein